MSSRPVNQEPREWLLAQIEALGECRNAGSRSPMFKLWRQTTLTVIQRIWPGDAARSERFRRIPFSAPMPRAESKDQREFFERGCAEAVSFLRELADEASGITLPRTGAAAPAERFAPGEAEDDFPTLDLPSSRTPRRPAGTPGTDEEFEGMPLRSLEPNSPATGTGGVPLDAQGADRPARPPRAGKRSVGKRLKDLLGLSDLEQKGGAPPALPSPPRAEEVAATGPTEGHAPPEAAPPVDAPREVRPPRALHPEPRPAPPAHDVPPSGESRPGRARGSEGPAPQSVDRLLRERFAGRRNPGGPPPPAAMPPAVVPPAALPPVPIPPAVEPPAAPPASRREVPPPRAEVAPPRRAEATPVAEPPEARPAARPGRPAMPMPPPPVRGESAPRTRAPGPPVDAPPPPPAAPNVAPGPAAATRPDKPRRRVQMPDPRSVLRDFAFAPDDEPAPAPPPVEEPAPPARAQATEPAPIDAAGLAEEIAAADLGSGARETGWEIADGGDEWDFPPPEREELPPEAVTATHRERESVPPEADPGVWDEAGWDAAAGHDDWYEDEPEDGVTPLEAPPAGAGAVGPDAGSGEGTEAEQPAPLGDEADDFLARSPVFHSTPHPVMRPPTPKEGVPQSEAAREIFLVAADVEEYGVPEGHRARARAALVDLARELDDREATWETLREAVFFVMEFPPLARRVLPLLLPYIEDAA
jgi:hypothetical protein